MGRSPSLHFYRAAALKLLKYNRIFDFAPASRWQIVGQAQGAVAQEHEAIYLRANRLKEAPHFAISTFLQRHAVPGVASRGFPSFHWPDGSERRRAILNLDAGAEFFKHFPRQASVISGDVAPVDFLSRVHQAIGELPPIGEDQQSDRINVEPAGCDPSSGGKT